MDSGDWRTQLSYDSRQRIVSKILDTLKKHLPISGPEGLGELQKIAVRFEEKIYTAATSQTDYLRRITVEMLTMDAKPQAGVSNSPAGGNQNPSDPDQLAYHYVSNLKASKEHTRPGPSFLQVHLEGVQD